MRINLIDPRYIRPGGHHVEWDLLIAKNLSEHGHEVRLYCSTLVSDEAARAFSTYGQVSPLFQSDPYTRPRNNAHELSLFIDVANLIAKKLNSLQSADAWLWPTLFPPHLLACAIARPDVPISGCMHWQPSYVLPHGEIWWQYAFEKASRSGLRLKLGAMTPGLQKIYSGLAGNQSIGCAPIAQDGIAASEPKRQMRRIGFFGMQRHEKGLQLLQSLISKLLAAGYEVVLQDSRGGFKNDRVPNLSTLGYVEDFAREVTSCDLIAIPYDPNEYRYRVSGVAAEALACGVPVVVPGGTELGSLVEKTGAGELFQTFSAESIYRAIDNAKRNFAGLAEAAFNTSRSWHKTHASEKFAQFLLGNAN